MSSDIAQTPAAVTALFVSSFVDELVRLGVKDVVVSPGSRSTPLSMTVFERSQRYKDLHVYLDVDERGAAFFALGLAKATGNPTGVICTSGTALANYYPAVMEAETSRVPLLVLSGDRPMRLQKLGAPQTCNQIEAFGSHVKGFWQLPEPKADADHLLYIRQVAREAVNASAPHSLVSGPVHVNFPFDEPLKPDFSVKGLFEIGRMEFGEILPSLVDHGQVLFGPDIEDICAFISVRNTICLCGEGTFEPGISKEKRDRQAKILIEWALDNDIPLLADPLSGLRNYDNPVIIDNYDSILKGEECPSFDTVIRFGRYPISKPVFKLLECFKHTQIVVDNQDTRDFNSRTTTLVKMNPMDFVLSAMAVKGMTEQDSAVSEESTTSKNPLNDVLVAASANSPQIGVNNADDFRALYGVMQQQSAPTVNLKDTALGLWAEMNQQAAKRIEQVDEEENDSFEGAYVYALANLMQKDSMLFSAASMSIRALDTFFMKRDSDVTILSNRGLNGIDGTLSTAFGAAQYFKQNALLIGDLAFIHDINALALQNEFALQAKMGHSVPCITVVLLNNKGGAIFDMLPQASDEPYFERLFLTPQQVDFKSVVNGFGVPYEKVVSVQDFRRAFYNFSTKAGISVIEVEVPLRGVRKRYSKYE